MEKRPARNDRPGRPAKGKPAPEPAPLPPGTPARRAALDLLERVRGGQPFDEALEGCRGFNELQGADRGFARAIASETLRRKGSLDHVIGAYLERPLPRKAAQVMDILRIAATQSLILGTPDHAVVSTAVALASQRQETQGYDKLINAVARKIAAAGAEPLNKLPARTDTPGWLWRSWERAYGPAVARKIAEAHRREAPLDLTVKDPATAPAWAEKLGGDLAPGGTVRLQHVSDVTQLDGFEEGAWWVQDLAASLPARLLGDINGKTVFDLCAAPGGKTLQLAAMGARVTAVDKSEPRLNRVSDNLARTQLTANVIVDDVMRWRSEERADAILLDAPCTASGTIRRHPDLPWSKTEDDVKALAALQAKMIDKALMQLKYGGMLVYCVCSLQREEGEAQADAALSRHPTLKRLPISPDEIGGLAAITPKGDLRTLPFMLGENGGMDGFFAARFRLER